MQEKPRKSGIDILGDVPWGTHFCQFYETRQDLVDILVPYFREGLLANEFCMWITAEPLTEGEAIKALREAVPDLDEYIGRGQIEVIPHTEWYLKDGFFDSDRVLAGWVEKLGSAMARGFDGLRLTGNTFWLEREGWRDFVAYEEAVDSVLGGYRIIALCTYSLERCGAGDVMDVVANHQFALMKREGRWELIESSERRRAEEALRESQADLNHAQAVAQTGSWRLDVRKNELTWSDEAHRIFGIPKGAPLTYETFLARVHPDDRGHVDANWQAALKGVPYDVEHRIVVGDDVKWVRERAELEFDGGGALLGGFGTTQDITSRKAMEEALRENEERLRKENRVISYANRILELFVKETGDALYDKALEVVLEGMASRHGVFGYIDEAGSLVCPTMTKIFDQCEIEGKCVCYTKDKWKGLWGRALAERKVLYSNRPAVVPKGHMAILNNMAAPILFHGEVIGLINLANKDGGYTEDDREIIEAVAARIAPVLYAWVQKELREEERKRMEQQRNDFLAMVTHDLKSPLSAIMGYSELMLGSKNADEDIRAMASVISMSGSKLLRMVEDFLTLSRVEAGRMNLNASPHDLCDLLVELRDEFEPVAEKKGLTFLVDICERLPRVRVDKKHFERVIGNLVENAFNYTPRGGRVSIKCEAVDGHVAVSVADTGAGVPPEDRDRIFDKYYRSPKTSGIKGTGLGLAIVKAITEAHGGKVELMSEPGKGATFRLVLPAGKG